MYKQTFQTKSYKNGSNSKLHLERTENWLSNWNFEGNCLKLCSLKSVFLIQIELLTWAAFQCVKIVWNESGCVTTTTTCYDKYNWIVWLHSFHQVYLNWIEWIWIKLNPIESCTFLWDESLKNWYFFKRISSFWFNLNISDRSNAMVTIFITVTIEYFRIKLSLVLASSDYVNLT